MMDISGTASNMAAHIATYICISLPSPTHIERGEMGTIVALCALITTPSTPASLRDSGPYTPTEGD